MRGCGEWSQMRGRWNESRVESIEPAVTMATYLFDLTVSSFSSSASFFLKSSTCCVFNAIINEHINQRNALLIP